MAAVRKPGTVQDMLVLELPTLKFLTIEIDPLTTEFRTVCMHNLKNDLRLQKSGKVNPR